jgi:hypothetical protein
MYSKMFVGLNDMRYSGSIFWRSKRRNVWLRARPANHHTPFRCFYQRFVGHAAAFFYYAQSSVQLLFQVIFRALGL